MSPSLPVSLSSLLLGVVLLVLTGCGNGFVSTADWRARQDDYLRFATATPLAPGSTLGLLNHLERASRDPSLLTHHPSPSGTSRLGAAIQALRSCQPHVGRDCKWFMNQSSNGCHVWLGGNIYALRTFSFLGGVVYNNSDL